MLDQFSLAVKTAPHPRWPINQAVSWGILRVVGGVPTGP